LIFSRESALSTNCEIFDILDSHNLLQSRHLQKPLKLLLTKSAKMGKASAGAEAVLARQVRRRGSHDGQGKRKLCGGGIDQNKLKGYL
jgi:hypothetical protein